MILSCTLHLQVAVFERVQLVGPSGLEVISLLKADSSLEMAFVK